VGKNVVFATLFCPNPSAQEMALVLISHGLFGENIASYPLVKMKCRERTFRTEKVVNFH
jgi:hypothetical protein